MNAWLAAALLSIIAAAFVGMLWLRREADRDWRRRQILRPMAEQFVQVQIVLVDRLTPAFREMGEAVARMAPSLERFAAAMREVEKK